MLPEQLVKFAENPIPVLDDGHILLVDVMGDEQAIIDAARVSYGAGTKRVSEDRNLIRYLLRHHHTSPFEMCEIKVRVRVPMDIWRQWVRHRTASINEYSTRYSEAINSMSTAQTWRLQATDNKQGSAGEITDWPDGTPHQFCLFPEDGSAMAVVDRHYFNGPGEYLSKKEAELHQLARAVYEERLKFGMAREQARKDLPLSTYTEAYWKIDLHNLLHFLRLRLHPHAQLEIRAYSEALASIVKVWMPTVWAAFEDYTLHAQTFSRMEMDGLKALMNHLLNAEGTKNDTYRKQIAEDAIEHALKASGLKQREAKEFKAKLQVLML